MGGLRERILQPKDVIAVATAAPTTSDPSFQPNQHVGHVAQKLQHQAQLTKYDHCLAKLPAEVITFICE